MKDENLNFDLNRFETDINTKGELTIPPNDIIKEIHATQNSFGAIPHEIVLAELLKRVKRIDFKSIVFPDYLKAKKEYKTALELKNANPDDEQAGKKLKEVSKKLASFKLQKKHYKIIAIEEILKLAKHHHWGLCKKHDFIYLYNGAYWQLLNESELKMFLGKAAEKMGVYKWDAKDEMFVGLLFKQFLFKAHLPEPKRDKEKVLINLLNGTFEITPNKTILRNFRRDDFIRYQLPFEYDPKAKAPIFESYLKQVQPDIERQKILSEFMGYVFTRHLKIEKTLLLYGTGANGKSVFFEIVNALLGTENVTSYSLQSLTNENGYYRAKLGNSLVNYASEINGKLETSIFKQLVSGEPVEARLPYGEPFTLKEYARLIFNCNALPRDVEHTNAYFRRFLIIPFDVTIPEKDQDKELSNKIIKGELSGVFNWVLEGLKRLLEQKRFTESKAVLEQVQQYRKESDSVQLFIDDENYSPSLTVCEPLKNVYKLYKEDTIENGLRPVSIRTFSKRMQGLGFEVVRKSFGKAIFIKKDISNNVGSVDNAPI